MSQKVLILGAAGMLGHTLFTYLQENTDYQLETLVFRTPLNESSVVCDITNKTQAEAAIKSINPDIIVNCIGVLIGGSTTNPANAIYINAFLPHFLSDIAEQLDARLIHISTDCVFSGKKGGYIETDFRDADDVYGRSKALGELINSRDLTLRTSIIGPELKQKGEGLLHWFLNQTGEVNGFTEAFWGGVTTLELSKVIVKVLNTSLAGVAHVTNGEAISKYELLQLFVKAFSIPDIRVTPFEGKQIDKSLQSTRSDLPFQVSGYEQMIIEMKEYMALHKNLYIANYQL